MPGRRPKPTALKELAGNPGKRPLNDAEPKPERGEPEMPKGMPPAARREWRSLAPTLVQLGVLSVNDGKALAAYCDAYAHWEKARREMAKYGLVIRTPKTDKAGNVIMIHENGEEEGSGRILYELKANPAVSVYNTFAKLMKSYLIEFGLTPASRAKLKVEAKPPGEDPLGKLLDRSKGSDSQTPKVPAMFDTGKPGMPNFTQIPDNATDFDA